jgi:hypothetical protein
LFGPSFLDKELHKFWPSTSCTSFRRSWTTEQEKATEISCEKDNATPTKQKRLQQNKKACKPRQKTQPSLYIGMNMIVKGLFVVVVG